jgi:alpha-L-rhamnosidase
LVTGGTPVPPAKTKSRGAFIAFAFRLLLTGPALTFSFGAVSPVRAEAVAESVPHLTDLRTDFRENPLAVESPRPPFSWRIVDPRQGAAQTAYQIELVEEGGDFSRPLWDSGRVASRQSHLVRYDGPSLGSKRAYQWRVRYWDQEETASAWSEPARFATAPRPDDWQAKWIEAAKDAGNDSDDFRRWTRMAILPTESLKAKPKKDGIFDQEILGAAEQLNKSPYFRREIDLSKPVKSARLRYAGIGFVEARINGQGVSDALLSPAVAQYSDAVRYVTYDVTGQLRPGRNALGFVLADGLAREKIAWPFPEFAAVYNPPALRAELEVEYEDGTRETFATDETWKQGTGGLLASNYWLGEIYDATAEPSGWDETGFDDSAWVAPATRDEPVGNPVSLAQSIQPQRVVRTIQPVAVKEPQPGVWVFEFPETFTGLIELKLPATQRSMVFVRPSEYAWNGKREAAGMHCPPRYPDGRTRELTPGMILCKGRSSAVQGPSYGRAGITRQPLGITTWACKPDGRSETVWQPKYSPQVVRYVEVTGLHFTPDLETVTGLLIHNDLPVHYRFECSEPVFEGLVAAAVASTLQNTQSMSWDNATERNQTTWPWTWAAPLVTASADFSLVYRTFLENQKLWVLPDGRTSGQTLTLRAHRARSSGAGPIHESPAIDLPWAYLAYFGDREPVREYYPLVRRFVDSYWQGTQGEAYLEAIRNFPLAAYDDVRTLLPGAPMTWTGDHGQQVTALRGQARSWSHGLYVTLGRWLDLLQKAGWMAGQFGEVEDQRHFEELSGKIIAAVRASAMRDPQTGAYGARQVSQPDGTAVLVTRDGNPNANALAVMEGIATPEEAQALADLVAADVDKNYGGAFPGGREWYRTLDLLSRHGHLDQAVEMMRSTELPAIAYFTEKAGFKTIPESRAALRGGVLHNSTVQSETQNFANWFVEILCGLQADPANPGQQDWVIAPQIPSNLDRAALTTQTPYGELSSGWERTGGKVTMHLKIPPNSSAEVVAPEGYKFGVAGAEERMKVPAGTYALELIAAGQGGGDG